jgi:hypothetical protein
MQKPLTAADWNRLEDALAAASFCTLDPIEEFRSMFDSSDWTIRGATAAGRVAVLRGYDHDGIHEIAARDPVRS